MSTVIYGLDPGTTASAIVLVGDGGPVRGYVWPNDALLQHLRTNSAWLDGTLVIEQVESFGMPVGREVFETVWWSGRFAEAWELRGRPWARVSRREVKLHICGSARAKDANIRQAIIDRFGGSKQAAIGVKAKKGPLYGLKGHEFAALAVAITYADTARARQGAA